MRKFLSMIVFVPVLMFLASCGDSSQAKIDAYVGIIERQIERLNSSLNEGNIQNAAILKTYADSLKLIKPDMAELIENLKRDAEPNCPAILRFKEQLEDVKSGANAVTKQETLEDLAALATATETEIYNDSLVDTINVLADLSEGALPRRSAPEKTSDEQGGAGSQLVGNSRYGRWENRGGQSMWVWFAAYSMFNRPYYRPYYYHSWHYHRPWSYHHDYGRSIYSTRSDRMRSNSVAK
ncbi:MAG: hypothetical protein KAJ75_02370, partial [Alphaproteobacteria bacterium]|nr:hypothetical protein [Alphaproteobacteria bacterium]